MEQISEQKHNSGYKREISNSGLHWWKGTLDFKDVFDVIMLELWFLECGCWNAVGGWLLWP
jgi:hypothetical protein